MRTLNFDEFYNFFQELIINRKMELYNNGEIKNDIKIRFFNNSGEYFTEVSGNESELVLCNIINDGGVQDTSVPIDAYVQIVSFELLAPEEYRPDLMILFTDICANYKSYIGELSGSLININISDFPRFSEKFDEHGLEKFNISFVANVSVMPGARLSNTMKLTINDEEVKFGNIKIARTNELMPQLKKQMETTFFPNTSVLNIQIDGLYKSSPIMKKLLNDCTKNNNFNQFYNIKIVDTTTDEEIVNRAMFYKDVLFSIVYGSIIAWNVSFFIGERVGG